VVCRIGLSLYSCAVWLGTNINPWFYDLPKKTEGYNFLTCDAIWSSRQLPGCTEPHFGTCYSSHYNLRVSCTEVFIWCGYTSMNCDQLARNKCDVKVFGKHKEHLICELLGQKYYFVTYSDWNRNEYRDMWCRVSRQHMLDLCTCSPSRVCMYDVTQPLR